MTQTTGNKKLALQFEFRTNQMKMMTCSFISCCEEMLERKNNMCNKKKKCVEGNEKYPNAGCCEVLEEKAAPNKAEEERDPATQDACCLQLSHTAKEEVI